MIIQGHLDDPNGSQTVGILFNKDQDAQYPFILSRKMDRTREIPLTWDQMRQLVMMMIPIFKFYGYDDFC